MKYLTIILLYLCSINAVDSNSIITETQHQKGTIEVIILNVDSTQPGNLIVNLYAENGWNKPDKSLKHHVLKNNNSSEYRISFDSIPFPNEYALQATHDTDGNGKLTMKWFPPGPKEGAGVTNYKPTGIPKFQKAKFYFSGEKQIVQIIMIYPD